MLPPLSVRATLAAWPPSRVDDPSQSGSTLRSTDTVQANNQGQSLCYRLECINACVSKCVYTYDVTNLSLSIPEIFSVFYARVLHQVLAIAFLALVTT